MVAIREWLHDHANQEFFTFDMEYFNEVCDEFLEGYIEAADPVTENSHRNHCWKLLQVSQRDREFLSSLNLHRIIARHVRSSCRQACTSPSIESWVELESARLDWPQLANEIEVAIRAAWKVQAPWRADPIPKFSEELLFQSFEKFQLGMESIIGYPQNTADYLEQMKREHEQGEPFCDHQGRLMDPKLEWNIVMGSEAWEITGAGWEPAFEIKKREIGKPLDFYIQKAKEIFSDFGAKEDILINAEVAALRLWTGPMHKKYTEVLRNLKKPGGQYVTTLHALNSGITKLARIWRLPSSRKVYRGYRNLSLKELKKDSFQCVGGVEMSVLATTEAFNIAVHYSRDAAFVLEMDAGQVNRGADVSWLSQFPHEREILFNALSNVEFVCSPQLRFVEGCGTILVYPVCVSANLKSKTLAEFVSFRKDLHLNLVDVLTQEVRRVISLKEEDSRYGLIKILCAECRNKCDCIIKESREADVGIFNEGGPAYAALVQDAILLPSRALQIIDLALHWFETGKVDPSALDRLQDWQLEALRTAFRCKEGPMVVTLFLEKVRVISSFFSAESLDLGTVHKSETLCNTAKLLTLNPNLNDLKMEVASGTAEVWEQVFQHLCPGRPRMCVNGFLPAEYAAVNTLQQLDLRNFDIRMAAMVAPALQFYTPNALTSLSLWGSPIGCTGAESLGRAACGLQRLRYVDLRSCMIADRGCTGISRGLAALSELEDLNLAHNNAKDDGFNILANAIHTLGLSTLKSVDMRYNDTQLPSLRCGLQCVMRNHLVCTPLLSTNCRVFCVAWNPAGDQIAIGLEDGTMINLDAKTGDHVSKFTGHTSWVTSVAWRNGGNQIVSSSWDRTIIMWDAKTGDQILTLKGHTSAVMNVAWHPGGDQLASASYDNTIIIWDANTGHQRQMLKGHSNAVTSVAWHPEGHQVASGSDDNSIIIWNAKNGQCDSVLKGHTSFVASVAWSPWGDQIASGSRDFTIIIWDAKSGQQVSTLEGHTSSVTSVAWCLGGKQIASGSWDKTIIIWDVKIGEQVSTLKGHTSCVNSVAWRPGGDQIVSCGYGDRDTLGPGEIIIWEATTGEQISTLKGHTTAVTSVAWRPGGEQFASGSEDGQIIIWDSQTGEHVLTLKGHTNWVTSLAWRPGGDQIASGSNDKTIIIWNTTTAVKILTLKGHSECVRGVAWNPNGDQIASGSEDNTIIISDAKTGEQILKLMGHTQYVTTVVWRPVGDHIASGSNDNTIIIWAAKSGEHISTLKGHSNRVVSVAWKPGGNQIASASWDKTIIIWDVIAGDQVSTLKGHACAVTSVAWCPWGDQIASGSTDNKIIIWDAKAGDQVSMLKGHINAVTSVAWHPNGNRIASGSCDKSIMIWDAKVGDQVSTRKGYTSKVTSAAISTLYQGIKNVTCVSSLSGTGPNMFQRAESGAVASTLQLGPFNPVQGVSWHGDEATSEIESAHAAIRVCSEYEGVDSGDGCQLPQPKKKKTHHREFQAL